MSEVQQPVGGADGRAALAAPREARDPAAFRATALAIEQEVAKVIVGQADVVRGIMVCLIANGHALLEGIPGVGKTSMARAFAAALGLSHNRVQCTPDLAPADITGTTILYGDSGRGFETRFEPGPIFTNLLLADEINRASPRTQSALLEAMQEVTVTVGGETHQLPRPFSVLATQNPVDMQGTYPLPEAQIDRFLLKLTVAYPAITELSAIVADTRALDVSAIATVADGPQLLAMNALAHQVPASSDVIAHISRLLLRLQPSPQATAVVRDYVKLGPSPRGGVALALAGRITALLAGRHHVSIEDVEAVALPALRHRLVLNFDAERERVSADAIVTEVLAQLRHSG